MAQAIITADILDTAIQEIFNAATQPNGGDDAIKMISAAVPQIVLKGKAQQAFELAVADSPNRRDWMAENFALFMTKGLSQEQRAHMISSAFPFKNSLSAADTSALAKSSARIGRLGFSFPIWRFVSQGFGNDKKALLEHFGMQRLRRDNDVRDEDLPFSNPQRDEWGAGFFWNKGQISIEYRRAYIACSIHNPMRPVTIVIRNSSHFYGRDRMPDAAYISFGFKNPDQIQNLTLNDLIGEKSNFAPLQDILKMPAIPSQKARLNSLRDVLDTLDEFDNRLSHWLGTDGPMPNNCNHSISMGTSARGGLPQLIEFMKENLDKAKARGNESAPIFLSHIDAALPAWNPLNPAVLDDNFLNKLAEIANGQQTQNMKNKKLVLLSSPNGDFPLGPKYSAELAAKIAQQKTTPSPK
jgi:hypothetical protein